MKKLVILIILGVVVLNSTAQDNIETILAQIETNSTSLQALRGKMDAEKIGNRTGLSLPDPELEFSYLWGSPGTIGNRTDFAITQSFDFPSAYIHRNRISRLQNANAELAYKAERINLMLQARQICINLIYYNALAKEYELRLNNTRQIATAYQAKLEKGETNAIETNKAQLSLFAINNEIAYIEGEKTILLAELRRLNGGKDISFNQNNFSGTILPAHFEEWYQQAETKNPLLQYVSRQIKVSEEQIKLNRSLGLPKFSAGYMSEKVVGERFQGVSIGISLPLWENRNRIRQARADKIAGQSMLVDAKVEFYNKLQGLYLKAVNLQQSAANYRSSIVIFNNESLLKKALDVGEISLLNYLIEIEYYYDAIKSTLEAEKEYELSVSELSAVEL